MMKALNFNSHPHEEDDSATEEREEKRVISTHILTKRMTLDEAAEKLSYYISTHILTKRMTYSTFKVSLRSYYFNSHPHEEDDRGRTGCDRGGIYFNSHPHEEDDAI